MSPAKKVPGIDRIKESILWIVLIWCGSAEVHSQTRTIQDLRDQVATGLASGQPVVVIEPGVYKGTVPENIFLVIDGAENVVLDATGVTLVCEKFTRALAINNCVNFTLKGLTIDYDPLPFTQGTIVAVDPGDTWLDVEIHEGYPVEPYSRMDLVDPVTRHRKYGMPFLWGSSAELRPNGIVRVSRDTFEGAAEVGDLVSLSTGPEPGGLPHGVTIEEGRELKLEDVTLYTCPGFGIINGPGYGDDHYDGVKVVPGPPPAGATEARLLSTVWDAIQFNNLRKGPLMENCRVESAGDDSWSLSSRDYLILAKSGTTVWLVHRVPWARPLHVGDRLAVSLDSTKIPVVSIGPWWVPVDECPMDPALRTQIENAGPWDFLQFDLRNILRLEVETPLPWEPGTSVYSPDRNCSGFILRNNVFHSPGRAGLITGASNGLIEGNTYIDVHSALDLYPELTGEGATGTENIIFRNNVIDGSNHFCPSPWSLVGAALIVKRQGEYPNPQPAGVYRNIVIENNTFRNVRGPMMLLTSIQDLRIEGNRFENCQFQEPLGGGDYWQLDDRSMVWLNTNTDVKIKNNVIVNRGPFGTSDPFVLINVDESPMQVLEKVDYPSGALNGATPLPATGLTGTWVTAGGGFAVAEGSLEGPVGYGYPPEGGHVTFSSPAPATAKADLSANSRVDMDADEVTFLSFLVNPGSGSDEMVLRLMSGANQVAWVGKTADGAALRVGMGAETSAGSDLPQNQTVLVVIRLTSVATGPDRIQASFFPTSVHTEPMEWDVTAAAEMTGVIDSLVLAAKGGPSAPIQVDALRMGATFSAVATGTLLPKVDADLDGMDDQWEERFFNSLSRQGSGDADVDGLVDYFEYVFASDPTDGGSRGSELRVLAGSSQPGPRIRWDVREGLVAGTDYEVWYSEDLASWDPLPSGGFSLVETFQNGVTGVELLLNDTLMTPAGFIRLQQPAGFTP